MIEHAPKPTPFIVGVGRSGTTLLRMMLDAHPELAIPSESHFIVDMLAIGTEATARDRFFHLLTQAPTWPNFALDDSKVRDALAKIEPFSTSEALRVTYQLYARNFGKQRWGEKTPSYRRQMGEIQRLLPEAHFIHMIRDGRDVALSYRGLWFGPGDDIATQARFWVEQVRAARAKASSITRYMEIRYEQLITAPEATLRKICDFLELAYNPVMLEYHRFASDRLAEITRPFGPLDTTPTDIKRFLSIYEKTKRPPDPSRVGRWRTEMPDRELKRYEEIASELLGELGYETRSNRTWATEI